VLSCQQDCGALRFGLVGCVPIVPSVLCVLDNLIPKPLNIAYSCGQLGSGPDMARQHYTCSRNIYFVGNRSTLSIAIELVLLSLNFVFD